MIKLDKWQEEFLASPNNKILCTGRQVGKSYICALDAVNYAISHPQQTILMIATTERQAYALFSKALGLLVENHRKLIRQGADRPTQTRIRLTNGTEILCLPTGLSGVGIRGLTVHRLYADEASRIPEPVWDAVTPMMLTTGGKTIFLSTPAGKQGMFYNVWINKDNAYGSFDRFFIDSEKCIEDRLISESWTAVQYEAAKDYLRRERSRMSELAYMQEYKGKFLDELRQFFPSELIRKVMVIDRLSQLPSVSDNANNNPAQVSNTSVSFPGRDFFLGVDVAAMGGDQNALIVLLRKDKKFLKQILLIQICSRLKKLLTRFSTKNC